MKPEPKKPEDVIPTFDREGPQWAAQRDRRLTERPWLDRALAVAPHSRGRKRVLDLGCGAGKPIAEYLLDRGAMVTGVDASRPMIELFAKVVPRAIALHADMRGLKLSETYDLLIAWDSFFLLPPDDQRAMFRTFADLAAPGAALLFTSGPRAGETSGRVCDTEVYHASLDPDEYCSLLDDAGFDVLGYWPEEPECGDHTIWLARRR